MGDTFTLSSPAFENGGLIPKKYSGDGDEVNPPFHIVGLPPQTQSLTIMLIDTSIPFGLGIHWVVWNIPPTADIAENTNVGVLGKNGFGKHEYLGPKPPFGTHKYLFKIYALNTILSLNAENGKKAVEKAMVNHVLAEAELWGLYKK